MTDKNLTLAMEAVRFFGRMTASASHEMKNILAILNENAGLLKDMLRMNQKGVPLNPERLSKLAASMHRQVERGDRTLKTMNRFAHSADELLETVDVGELIHFIIRLCHRLITLKGTVPLVEAATPPVTVVTNRFYLEQLVWACLCHILDECRPNQKVVIAVDGIGNNVNIHFRGLPAESLEKGKNFISEEEALIAEFLGIAVIMDENEKQLSLAFQ